MSLEVLTTEEHCRELVAECDALRLDIAERDLLIADLNAQLDLANAAAVRMARRGDASEMRRAA